MNPSRTSGILLHITSLPSPYGIGDFGPSAYQFADFLVAAHQRLWQVLPLVPVGYGYSPYAGLSTFAGDVMLISPDRLLEQGLLQAEDVADCPDFTEASVDFEPVMVYKEKLLKQAFARFEAHEAPALVEPFHAFCRQQAYWLEDYALFRVLKKAHGDVVWTDWAPALARRESAALEAARQQYARDLWMQKFWQFLFDQQWRALKAYCNARNVQIFGDLPIYVAHDSADVWSSPALFSLDAAGQPTVVAGVPPDYFSETGQRWGNPLYRWDIMQQRGFSWWTQRFARILEQVDLVRLDHFRGFEAYWEVPASEETAVKGRWVKGPGAALFETLRHKLGTLPVVAENLGVITDGVTALMERFGFPGMAILQFAFDGDVDADFLPHNYPRNLVAYTGTHDNDTLQGWWAQTQSTQDADTIAKAHQYCQAYLNFDDPADLHWAFVRALMGSVADTVVFPLQDLLGLGAEARMNTPGKGAGNWGWRYAEAALTPELRNRLKNLTWMYGRSTERTLPDLS